MQIIKNYEVSLILRNNFVQQTAQSLPWHSQIFVNMF